MARSFWVLQRQIARHSEGEGMPTPLDGFGTQRGKTEQRAAVETKAEATKEGEKHQREKEAGKTTATEIPKGQRTLKRTVKEKMTAKPLTAATSLQALPPPQGPSWPLQRRSAACKAKMAAPPRRMAALTPASLLAPRRCQWQRWQSPQWRRTAATAPLCGAAAVQ